MGVNCSLGCCAGTRTVTPFPPPPDVDECETVVCPGENQQCENTDGSYRCVCAEGYRQEEGVCVKEQIPGKQGGGRLGWPGQACRQAPPPGPTSPPPKEAVPGPCVCFQGWLLRLHFLTSQLEREPDLAPKHSASLSLFSPVQRDQSSAKPWAAPSLPSFFQA